MIERTTRWLDEWRLLIAVLFVIGAVAAGEMVYGALRPRSGPHSWYLLRVDGGYRSILGPFLQSGPYPTQKSCAAHLRDHVVGYYSRSYLRCTMLRDDDAAKMPTHL